MVSSIPEHTDRVSEEPTLGALLRDHARVAPEGFYRSLPLAFVPIAALSAAAGFWRAAMFLILLSAFGGWMECEQRLHRDETPGSRHAWLRLGKLVAAGVGGAITCALLLELFMRMMGDAPTF